MARMKGTFMPAQQGVRRFARLAAIGLGLLFASGCNSLPTTVPPDANAFAGFGALVGEDESPAPTGPLRVFMLHGMGTTDACDFNGFIFALANRLGLTQILPEKTEPLAEACSQETAPASPLVIPRPRLIAPTGAPAPAKLYTYAFARSAARNPALKVSFLLWSPLTAEIKSKRLNELGAPPRQAFAQAAKDFINDKFGDVVLYSGSYRDTVLRPAVEAALCYVVEGTPSRDGRDCRHGDYQEPTVLITHSMGGYMLMDAIDDELTRGRASGAIDENSAAAKIVGQTESIFMLANQLALLDLTTLTSYPSPAASSSRPLGFRSSAGQARRLMRNFALHWAQLRLKSHRRRRDDQPGIPVSPEQIVAFSDPDDILSWLVTKDDLGLPQTDASGVLLTNVYASNGEFQIPSTFSDPVKAHTGYFDNPAVIDLLVCGMAAGAVKPCPNRKAP